jgi:transcriptional regulator with XRE-family HTH domain
VTKTHSTAAVILGERLRGRRLELELTLEDLAALADTHWTSIGKIERGQVHPGVETLVRLATALNSDPGVFVAELHSLMYPARVHRFTAADFIRSRQASNRIQGGKTRQPN